MTEKVKEFINIFSVHYPFQHFFFVDPKEMKDCSFGGLKISCFTVIGENGFVFFETENDIIFLPLCDLANHVQEAVMHTVKDEFGPYAYECLYVEHEDKTRLNEILENQRKLNTSSVLFNILRVLNNLPCMKNSENE